VEKEIPPNSWWPKHKYDKLSTIFNQLILFLENSSYVPDHFAVDGCVMTGRFLQFLPWLTQAGLRLAVPDLGSAVARGGPGLVVPDGPGPEDPPPAPAGFQSSPLACRRQRFALDGSSGSG
jgi:hypothetical protein